MNRIRCERSMLAVACALAISQGALAQTATAPVTIPLDVIQESGGGVSYDRLGIYIGVNGATPEEYIFDTGSTSFNIDVGSNASGQPWFPMIPGVAVTPTFPAFTLYGDGTYGNLGANTTVGSIQFYNASNNSVAASFTSGPGLPVLINQGATATAASLNGDQQGAQVGWFLPTYGYAFTDAEIAGFGLNTTGEIPMYLDATWQQNLDAGIGPEDGGGSNLFGIFGAGEFGTDSVLGNLTSTGYIVAANNQRGNPQNCSGCGHVILNLTPALRAQFISLVPWNGGSAGTFPLSGAPVSANQFDLAFAYTLNGGKYSATLQTLLDSGTPTIYLNDQGLLTQATSAGQIDANGNVTPGVTLTMTGVGTGTQPTSILTGNDNLGDQSNVVTPGPNGFTNQGQALYGISFFFNNSVMYDLQNKETGYTPFFVSIDPIATGANGYVVTNSVAPQGIAGVISGSGAFVVGSGGAAQLTGTNTYTGPTDVAQGGWLGIAGPGTIAGSSGVQADGTFDVSRVSGPAAIQSLSGAGRVALGGNTLALTNASGTFSGVLSDGGLGGGAGGSVVIAGGMEGFTGANTYTGNTGIGAQGGLMLDGSVAGNVLDAGVLTGHGTIGGGLVVTGMVAPGDNAGTYQTLTVNGNYLQGAGAIYAAQLGSGSTGQSSRIAVSGAAQIGSGATLAVLAAPPGHLFVAGTQYTLLSASQGLAGTFALAGNTGLSAVLGLTAAYDANNMYLDVVQTQSLATIGSTSNQMATLTSVQSLAPADTVFAGVANLATNAQIRMAGDLLSGELYASQQSARVEDSRYVRDAMNERLRQGDADAEAAQVGATRLTAWVHSWGHWGSFDGDGNAAGLSDNGTGTLVGADLPVGRQGHVGVAGGAERDTLSVNARDAWARTTTQWLGAYGGFESGAFALRAGVAYAWQQLPINRQVNIPGLAGTLSASPAGSTLTGYVEGAWHARLAGGDFAPYLNLAQVHVATDRAVEAGGAAALLVNSDSQDTTLSTLGVRGAWRVANRLALNAGLGWQHAFGDITPRSTQAFAEGGSGFTVYGLPLEKDAAKVNLGVAWTVSPSVEIDAGYDGLLASGNKDQSANVRLNITL